MELIKTEQIQNIVLDMPSWKEPDCYTAIKFLHGLGEEEMLWDSKNKSLLGNYVGYLASKTDNFKILWS